MTPGPVTRNYIAALMLLALVVGFWFGFAFGRIL